MTDEKNWERLFLYEVRVVSVSEAGTEREFRCPVCHKQLRVGKGTAEYSDPAETLGRELVLGDKTYPKTALVCPKAECRALLYLTHTS